MNFRATSAWFLLCSFLWTMTFLLACENVQILPPDAVQHSEAIINGQLDTKPAHNAVMTLYAEIGSWNTGLCTATLITPQYVLTAAHCIKDLPGVDEDRRVEPYRPYMRLGVGNSVNQVRASYQIEEFYPHPEYGHADPTNDIAIIKLSKAVPSSVAVPIPPLPPSKSFAHDDTQQTTKLKVEVVGFGLTNYHDSNSSGVKYAVSVNVAGVCGLPDVTKNERSCSINGSYQSASWGTFYYYPTPGGACSGDSGGPVIHVKDGMEYVAGVTSAGYGECNSYNIVVRVADYYDYIESLVEGLPVDEKEICDNKIDDNGDGRIDCKDPYCAWLPMCIAENCTNGIDDNGDGLVDCDDPKCVDKKICQAEDCYNGIDDNGDGLVDCDDPKCADLLRCRPEDCTNGIDDNGDGLVDCDDPKCARIIFCIKEHCSNGKDDNRNGLVDCDDPQCADDIACQPEICDNALDDNGDGYVDCDDPQCLDAPHCAPEICDNSVDDNFDALVDCDDPDCAAYPACKAEICDNEKDDNADGLVDCEEPSCKETQHCQKLKDAQACSYHSAKKGQRPGSAFLLIFALFLLVLRARPRLCAIRRS
ncbi:MAG: trypsin-like serine protease [Bradymonadales bacterium]